MDGTLLMTRCTYVGDGKICISILELEKLEKIAEEQQKESEKNQQNNEQKNPAEQAQKDQKNISLRRNQKTVHKPQRHFGLHTARYHQCLVQVGSYYLHLMR